MEDSGSIPPPIMCYQSSAYITSGGYFPFLKVLGYFYFLAIINVLIFFLILMELCLVMISEAVVNERNTRCRN